MTLNFIDIARSQAGIDLSVIPNLHGVIVGATFGCEGVNPECDKQFQQAKSLNLLRGVYHIRDNTNHTPEEEGDFFVNNILGYLDGNTVLVLDWEECDTSDVDWAYSFLNHVRERTGVTPIIYMSEAVVQAHNWDKVAQEFSLWIAQYNYSTEIDGFQNWDPTYKAEYPVGNGQVKPWPVVAMWQYASTDLLPGYGAFVDVDIFYGDADAWHKYSAINGTATPAPVPHDQPPAPANAPAPVAVQSVPTAHFPAIVSPGDSLSSIANQFGTTVGAILNINSIANPDLIYPGQVINIPGNAPAQVNTGYRGQWIVDPGDTLSSIAAYYGVSVESIVEANGIANPDLIYPGQVLNIP